MFFHYEESLPGKALPAWMPALLGLVTLGSALVGWVDSFLPADVQKGRITGRFIDVQRSKGEDKRYEAVRISLDSGDLTRVRSERLWNLLGERSELEATVWRTPIRHEVNAVSIDDEKVRTGWTDGGFLIDLSVMTGLGVFLLGAAGGLVAWRAAHNGALRHVSDQPET